MKAILKRIIRYISAVIKRVFGSHKREQAGMKIVHSRYGVIYRNSMKLLKGGPDTSYRPLYGTELKMLSRRLKQFRRVEWSGSRLQKDEAARRLQKVWKQILRNRLRMIKGNKGISTRLGVSAVERSMPEGSSSGC